MPPIQGGDIVHADRIYSFGARKEMLNVHLYFTKLTGCHLFESGVIFDQTALAHSILTGRPNTYIYLKFGISRAGLLCRTLTWRCSPLTAHWPLPSGFIRWDRW
jgi:hypothetical protein